MNAHGLRYVTRFRGAVCSLIIACVVLPVLQAQNNAGIVALPLRAQKADTRAEQPCRSTKVLLADVSNADPAINQKTINEDRGTIVSAQKEVRKYYASRGFDACAGDEATALAWRDFRRSKPTGTLDKAMLIQQASEGFGGLRIFSDPPGATIWVDDKRWERPTNYGGLTHVGKRTIVLSLSGYKNSEGEKEVVAGQWVEFRKKLEKQK
jgi:hypothetical protein